MRVILYKNTNVMHIDTSLREAYKSDCYTFPGKRSKVLTLKNFETEFGRQSCPCRTPRTQTQLARFSKMAKTDKEDQRTRLSTELWSLDSI